MLLFAVAAYCLKNVLIVVTRRMLHKTCCNNTTTNSTSTSTRPTLGQLSPTNCCTSSASTQHQHHQSSTLWSDQRTTNFFLVFLAFPSAGRLLCFGVPKIGDVPLFAGSGMVVMNPIRNFLRGRMMDRVEERRGDENGCCSGPRFAFWSCQSCLESRSTARNESNHRLTNVSGTIDRVHPSSFSRIFLRHTRFRPARRNCRIFFREKQKKTMNAVPLL